jgi:tRNA1(Val) A37 N6-methylase TrmN6
MMIAKNQKLTGSFYTESKVAESIVNWAIRHSGDSLLEPSFGDGIFVTKSLKRYFGLGNSAPKITAVEIQAEAVEHIKLWNSAESFHIIINDFLSLDLSDQFDAVIGNPPYVGIKNLSNEQRMAARSVIAQHNVRCPDNGSLWFPFVLHAIASIKENGRLAFVLPFEITYARYAVSLWNILADNFSNLSICRIYEDFFPNVDVETILLLAEGKGGETVHIDYNVYNTVDDLLYNNTSQCQKIPISNIAGGKKPFISTLLPQMQQRFLQKTREQGIIKPIIDSCKFKIGYVSADKSYFHPNADVVEYYSIPKANLFPAVLNAKELNGGTGIGIEVKSGECTSNLYLPRTITQGDKLYIQSGERLGVHQRYKCRQRNPWYITPNIEVPDIILSVFGEMPKMVANRGHYAVSNSLLCGYLKRISVEQLLCRWYNSLTLLSLELNVHSLGGGSFVIIPGEADKLEIVGDIPMEHVPSIFKQLNAAVKNSGVEAAYILGDQIVLHDIFGFSNDEIDIIRQAIIMLRNWRSPVKRREQHGTLRLLKEAL